MRQAYSLLWIGCIVGSTLLGSSLHAQGILDNLNRKVDEGLRNVEDTLRGGVERVVRGKDDSADAEPADRPYERSGQSASPAGDPAIRNPSSDAAARVEAPLAGIVMTQPPSIPDSPFPWESLPHEAGAYHVMMQRVQVASKSRGGDSAVRSSQGHHVLSYPSTVNGEELDVSRYERNAFPLISPDGNRIAYIRGLADYQEAVVVDGREGPPWRRRHPKMLPSFDNLMFSADSRHFGYVWYKRAQNTIVIVIDGREHELGEGLGGRLRALVSNGGRFAAAATATVPVPDQPRQVRHVLVVDGRVGPPYDQIDHVAFSPDGQHVAYVARKGGRYVLVLDGREGQEYPGISHLVFSPDGARYAYGARVGRASFVMVVDGKEGPEFDGDDNAMRRMVNTFTWSPDSKRFAYRVPGPRSARRDRIVVDGEVGPSYGEVSFPELERWAGMASIVFSPDSQHVAYWGRSQDSRRDVVVVDAEEYDGTGPVAFSPDGSRIIYRRTWGSGQNQQQAMVVNHTEGPRYLRVGGLTFSPDGTRMAYWARGTEGGGGAIVVDGVETPVEFSRSEWNRGISIFFCPDGKRVGYYATEVVFDGQEGPRFDDMLGKPMFHSGGILEYVVVRRGYLTRVRHVPSDL